MSQAENERHITIATNVTMYVNILVSHTYNGQDLLLYSSMVQVMTQLLSNINVGESDTINKIGDVKLESVLVPVSGVVPVKVFFLLAFIHSGHNTHCKASMIPNVGGHMENWTPVHRVLYLMSGLCPVNILLSNGPPRRPSLNDHTFYLLYIQLLL